MPGPAPSRNAASWARMASSTWRSGLSSGSCRCGRSRGVRARIAAQQEHVGLERGVAVGHHLSAHRHDVVERAHRRDAHLLGPAHPVGGAVRPVQANALADGATEEGVDRYAERAGLDVEQRVFDRPDGLLDHPAGGLPAHCVHQSHVGLPRPGVLADEQRREPRDRGGNADAAEGLVVLAPADKPLVGGDLQEVEGASAAVGMQRLHLRDLHRVSSVRPVREAGPAGVGYRSAVHLGKRPIASTLGKRPIGYTEEP